MTSPKGTHDERMRYFRLMAVLLLLVACGDGGTTPTGPPPSTTPVATSVTLSSTTLSFSAIGETKQLTATVKDQNGATMASAPVTWTSTNTAVATVSSDGLVTSVASIFYTEYHTLQTAPDADSHVFLNRVGDIVGRIDIDDLKIVS